MTKVSSHPDTFSMSNVEAIWRLYNFKKKIDVHCAGQKDPGVTCVIWKYIYNIIEITYIN